MAACMMGELPLEQARLLYEVRKLPMMLRLYLQERQPSSSTSWEGSTLASTLALSRPQIALWW